MPCYQTLDSQRLALYYSVERNDLTYFRQMLEDISGETSFTQSSGFSDSYRWFAPELYEGAGSLSIQSDIFSFGMTVLEASHPCHLAPKLLI